MKRAIVLIALAPVVCALPVNGVPITIEIEAVVDSVRDESNYLEGKIKTGDIITGSYTYDLLTPDSEPLAYAGFYENRNPATGISLNVGDFDFRSNPDNVYFVVAVLNDYPPSLKDQFWMCSYNNLPFPNGGAIRSISWQLDDATGTALYSTELPPGAPVLDDWESTFGLEISIGKSGVRAHVTSAIPEPVTILLLGLGAMLLRKRQ
jgi:hypothetical protein